MCLSFCDGEKERRREKFGDVGRGGRMGSGCVGMWVAAFLMRETSQRKSLRARFAATFSHQQTQRTVRFEAKEKEYWQMNTCKLIPFYTITVVKRSSSIHVTILNLPPGM